MLDWQYNTHKVKLVLVLTKATLTWDVIPCWEKLRKLHKCSENMQTPLALRPQCYPLRHCAAVLLTAQQIREPNTLTVNNCD